MKRPVDIRIDRLVLPPDRRGQETRFTADFQQALNQRLSPDAPAQQSRDPMVARTTDAVARAVRKVRP